MQARQPKSYQIRKPEVNKTNNPRSIQLKSEVLFFHCKNHIQPALKFELLIRHSEIITILKY